MTLFHWRGKRIKFVCFILHYLVQVITFFYLLILTYKLYRIYLLQALVDQLNKYSIILYHFVYSKIKLISRSYHMSLFMILQSWHLLRLFLYNWNLTKWLFIDQLNLLMSWNCPADNFFLSTMKASNKMDIGGDDNAISLNFMWFWNWKFLLKISKIQTSFLER